MKRLAAIALLLSLAACGTGDGAAPVDGVPPASSPRTEPETTGSLSFALTLQDGVELDAFDYAITGPSFAKSGQIDVSDSNTVSALINGIPGGSGYSITLMGVTSVTRPNGAAVTAQCSGSATFAVTAGAVTSVPVAISCRVEEGEPSNPVPLPPLAPIALGSLLLAIGTLLQRRRVSRSQSSSAFSIRLSK
jgi:hypothetical protein